jgi:hypothetical protein
MVEMVMRVKIRKLRRSHFYKSRSVKLRTEHNHIPVHVSSAVLRTDVEAGAGAGPGRTQYGGIYLPIYV